MPQYQPANPGHLSLDAARAAGCTAAELRIVELRNADQSWRVVADQLGCSRSACRTLWARACRRIAEGPVTPYRDREDPTVGNERHARGVPIMVRGVGGAIRGTRPGDPGWLTRA